MATAPIVATPANLIAIPYMDMMLAGLPVWLWIMLAFMFAIVLSNMWWIYKRMVMSPVIGYLQAKKLGQPQTLFIGKNRAFSIKFLEYEDSVLSYKDTSKVSKWLVQSPKSVGRLGGLSTMLVRDNYDYSLDPLSEIAICELAKDWNEKHPDDPINDYKTFAGLRDSGSLIVEYPDGIIVPVYTTYDPSLIQKYLPYGRSAGITGSHLTFKANELRTDKSQEKWYEKYVPIGVSLTISIIMLAIAYMYATSGSGGV